MNLQHLRHFVAIADAGSLREAAKLLNLSQSAITKSLKVLEQELGTHLVDRGSRGSILTFAGREVLAHARVVGAGIENIHRRLREIAGTSGNNLSVGTAAAGSIELLPETITFFRARYPKVNISVHGGLPLKLLPRLLDGSIDLVIGPRPGVALPSSIQTHALFSSENVIVVRKGHPLQRARSLREFADATWVLTSELNLPDSCLGMARAAAGMPPLNVVLVTDEPFLTELIVARTDYATVIRKCFFSHGLMIPGVVEVDIPNIDLSEQLTLFWRKVGSMPFLAERFMEALQTHAAKRIDSLNASNS